MQKQVQQAQAKQGLNVRSLKEVKNYEIPVLTGTVFDVFGGLPQSFIGISGEAGAGKSQTLMRFISDVAKKEPVLVVLTEQSPHRWKAIFNKYETNEENVKVVYKGEIDLEFVKELAKRPERIIVIDSLSGAVREQNARNVAKYVRNLSEWYNKWVITSLQVRKEGVAGGEGVEHMIEISYEISRFTLKPQNKWLLEKLKPYGYDVGDTVHLIRNTFDKIRGVQNTNLIAVDIDKETGILEFRELGKKVNGETKQKEKEEQTEEPPF